MDISERKVFDRRIEALDAARAISLLFIVWFHFWEQSWLTPYITYNKVYTRYFGITGSDLHSAVRFGYIFVDLFIIISAITNFLPFARAIYYHEKMPDILTYYKKRAVRILPSYLLCILIMAIVAFASGEYSAVSNKWFPIKDIITHLTFTSTFFKDTYRQTKLNGALWTVQVEVIWYLFIPYLARLFRKWPIATIASMVMLGVVSSNILIYHASDLWTVNNFVTTFASDYAVGFVVCMLFLTIRNKEFDNKYTRIFGFLMVVFSVICYISMLNKFYEVDRPYGQLYYRFEIALIFGILILGLMLLPPKCQKFMSNRLFAFIGTISYNLYIWHQVISVWLKKLRIPSWSGDKSPNELGDMAWSRRYFVLCIIDALLVAVAITYLYDIPVTKFLSRKLGINKQKESKLDQSNIDKE